MGRLLALILLGIIMIGAFAGKQDSTKPAADAKPDSGCHTDLSKCADNDEVVNSNGGGQYSHATIACKSAANEMAKYGSPTWPWFAFSHYRSGKDYAETGLITLVEPDAQFLNGFNAPVHTRVQCTYNARCTAKHWGDRECVKDIFISEAR